MSAINILFWRLSIAFVIPFIIFAKKIFCIDKKTILIAAILGVLLFTMLYCVTYGVKHTSASNASFLITTSVIFVPLLELGQKKKISIKTVPFTICVMLGMWLLCMHDNSIRGNIGDLFCIMAGLIRAVQIIITDKYVKPETALAMGVMQIGVAALLSMIINISTNSFVVPESFNEYIYLICIGVLCTSVGFVLQCKVQNNIKPVTLSVIFALEPVFTLIYSVVLFGYAIIPQEGIGIVLILIGVIMVPIIQG